MVADDADGPAWRCSGTLISPTVFLMAGPCAFETEAARGWFDNDLTDNDEYPYGGVTSVEGVPYSHPNFDGTIALPLSLIHISEPTRLKTRSRMPSSA